MKKHLFFVTYGGGHAEALVPIVKALMSRDNVDVTVMALTTARSLFEAQNIRTVGFRDFTFLMKGDGWHLHGERLAQQLLSGVGAKIDFQESVAYLGINYQDLEDRVGAVEAEKLFSIEGRQAFLPLGFISSVIQEVAPDMVVTTSAPRCERAALLAARELELPTICVVDLFATREHEWMAEDDSASLICVMSEDVKRHLVGKNISAAKIAVTGNPAFDEVRSVVQLYRSAMKGRRQAQKYNILFASQVEPSDSVFADTHGDPLLPEKIEESLRAWVDRHPHWNLIVRLHPNENRRVVPSPRVTWSHNSEPLCDALKVTDVVVTLTSSVGLQAAICGIPFVRLTDSIFERNCRFDEFNISTITTSLARLEHDLTSNMAELISDSLSDQWHNTGNQNAATNIIVTKIFGLMETHGNVES